MLEYYTCWNLLPHHAWHIFSVHAQNCWSYWNQEGEEIPKAVHACKIFHGTTSYFYLKIYNLLDLISNITKLWPRNGVQSLKKYSSVCVGDDLGVNGAVKCSQLINTVIRHIVQKLHSDKYRNPHGSYYKDTLWTRDVPLSFSFG